MPSWFSVKTASKFYLLNVYLSNKFYHLYRLYLFLCTLKERSVPPLTGSISYTVRVMLTLTMGFSLPLKGFLDSYNTYRISP
jgi:hypothetical protein